jgi:quercetin dioxygenase-like cupin family protein
MSSYPFVVHEREVPVEREDESGVTWQTLTSSDRTPTRELTSGLCRMTPGAELSLHRHPALEIYYFLEGTGIVWLGDVRHDVEPGVTVSIPADYPHGVRNTGPGILKFFYVFPTDSYTEIVYTAVDGPAPVAPT